MKTYFTSFSIQIWFILHSLLYVCQAESTTNKIRDEEEKWQQCSTFLAPSTLGWGVFAARPFAPNEIVEIAPLVLPMHPDAPVIKNSALDDYVYGFWRFTGNELIELLGAMLGMTMFLNHHSEPNVQFTTFGREPAPDAPNATIALGFKAKRYIQEGEELFSTYGEGDGGQRWFRRRGLELYSLPKSQTQIPKKLLPNKTSDYCSHIVAGPGLPAWELGVLSIIPKGLDVGFWMDTARLPPQNAAFGNAFAKHAISKGNRIEITPALVMSRSLVDGSIVGAVVFRWEDLTPENQQALRKLRQRRQLFLQFQDYEHTNWKFSDGFQSFEDTVLFPAAGNIGMVRRVGRNKKANSNCRLKIHSAGDANSIGVTLELVATKDIDQGEILRLNLPSTSSPEELDLFHREMKLTGQHYGSEFRIDSKNINTEL